MAKDPTNDAEFKRVLGNLLSAKPKPQADMKVGKKRTPAEASARRSNQKKNNNRNSPKASG
jgi:hypothetical protein